MTNSKPELCKVCGGSRDHPEIGYADGRLQPPNRAISCAPCNDKFHSTAPIHADKHKRVAERISKALSWGEYTRREVERILREEYPE